MMVNEKTLYKINVSRKIYTAIVKLTLDSNEYSVTVSKYYYNKVTTNTIKRDYADCGLTFRQSALKEFNNQVRLLEKEGYKESKISAYRFKHYSNEHLYKNYGSISYDSRNIPIPMKGFDSEKCVSQTFENTFLYVQTYDFPRCIIYKVKDKVKSTIAIPQELLDKLSDCFDEQIKYFDCEFDEEKNKLYIYDFVSDQPFNERVEKLDIIRTKIPIFCEIPKWKEISGYLRILNAYTKGKNQNYKKFYLKTLTKPYTPGILNKLYMIDFNPKLYD